MNPQIQSALIGAASGAAFGYVFFVKKAGQTTVFDPRKMLQPVLVGAAAGLLFGWQGQELNGIEGILEKAGSAGILTALVQLGTRQGGPLLTNLLGNLGGVLKGLGK